MFVFHEDALSRTTPISFLYREEFGLKGWAGPRLLPRKEILDGNFGDGQSRDSQVVGAVVGNQRHTAQQRRRGDPSIGAVDPPASSWGRPTYS
jgi:hypothetical protein